MSPMTFNKQIIFTLGAGLISTSVFADPADEYIYQKLKLFGIGKYETLPVNNALDHRAKVELGRRLFMDPNLSGNRNISCMTCHHPMTGTSDGLALSQTEDRKRVLRRNANSLYNVGDPQNQFMFWDGRVHYNLAKKIFKTPEASFNGENPVSQEITSVMQSALSAQAIFPIVNSDEMKGQPGDNEIANAKTDLESWGLVVKRLTSDQTGKYNELFNRAYPGVQKVNIGHVGEAMGTFMRETFQSNGSPFNRYAAGEATALTPQQKRGLQVFMSSNCIACHSGPTLGNNTFFTSVGVPFYGARPFAQDKGRAEVINDKSRAYFFKTPSLINVGLSAPYMHNGAFKTLREVINHYNDIETSITTFDISKRRTEFPVEVEVLNSPADLNALRASIQAGFLRRGLGMTTSSMDDLEVFLKEALTDPKWDPKSATGFSPF